MAEERLGSLTGDLSRMQSRSGWAHPNAEVLHEDAIERVIADNAPLDGSSFVALVGHHLGDSIPEPHRAFMSQHVGLMDEQGRPTAKVDEVPRTRAGARELVEKLTRAYRVLAERGDLPPDVDDEGVALGGVTSDYWEREAEERRERHERLYGSAEPEADLELGSLSADLKALRQRERQHQRSTVKQRQRAAYEEAQRRRISW
jgi:hypothetical protein